MNGIPLSLYIHIPWCERKCPYCDFNSHLAKQAVDEEEYVTELLHDLDTDIIQFGSALRGRAIQSVFIGGGTPSLFAAPSYQLLFDGVRDRLDFAPDCEITLEANPGSSEVEKFSGFRETGINRLSIGVQSFNQAHLSALGRVHNANEASNAAGYAREAGFDNFNLDLMFGLPDQSQAQALADLRQAIALKPTHLSCYQLTIEPNTLFHHSPPITPDDDTLWDMQEALQANLALNGYHQYEVSAYARDSHRCQHNLNYWKFGDYIGIGAGAHGKISTPTGVTRSWKIKHPSTYIKRESKIGSVDVVDTQLVPFEFMMNALRLNQGFSVAQFEQRCLRPIGEIDQLLDKHQSLNLIERTPEHIKPTAHGHNMLDSMLEDYLAAAQCA